MRKEAIGITFRRGADPGRGCGRTKFNISCEGITRSKKFALTMTVHKALKWSLQYVNFEKNFWGSLPPDPLEKFRFFILLQLNSAGKIRLKMSKFAASPRKKTQNIQMTCTHFQKKGNLRSFLRLTSLSLVNIEPNPNCMPPPKFSESAADNFTLVRVN